MAERLYDDIWSIVTSWQYFERNTVGIQLVKAADSIGANIAEGAGRGTPKENKRFVRISRGSLNETKYWIRRASMRRLINDYVVSPKNEYKLNRWLDWAKRFEYEIENNVAVTNGHELSKVFEAENILNCATFSTIASLTRKESRWGTSHFRTDYPETDDENWLCHIDIYREDNPKDIKVSVRALNRNLPS